MLKPNNHLTKKNLQEAASLPGNSIAILPFVNMSPDPENEYFSDGITEEIINAMTKVEGLKVTARTSSFVFKKVKLNIQEIGRQLNVATILEGSVRMAKNKVRITAQLINVEDGFHFWSETFDRELEDIFEVQEEVSLLIAEKLRENTGHFEIGDQLVDPPQLPIETYKLYLKGRYYIRKLNKPDAEKGILLLKEVVRRQPDYPLAHLEIHYAYTFFSAIGALPAGEAFALAKPYLDKAIALDPDLPECHLHLGGLCFWQNWDHEAAYRHWTKAIEIRPSYMEAYQVFAPSLASDGKFEAAFHYINIALQLDPFSPINHYYKGTIYYMQEKYPQAIECFKKALSLEPHLTFAYLLCGGSLMLMGQPETALELYNTIPEVGEADLSILGGRTIVHAMLGNQEFIEKGMGQLQEKLTSDAMGRALFFLILVHTILGNNEKALDLLEEGIHHKVPTLVLIQHEPLLKPLRSFSRYQTMLKKVIGKPNDFNLPSQKYQSSSLKKEDQEAYHRQLEKCMSENQPYLDPQLSLRSLARMIHIHPNQLSQLLNEKIGQNFAEYVNSFRLEDFKSRAANPSNHHMTILGLAFDSGFSSKTVFNTFFKKKMGITPRQYWKRFLV